MNSERQIIFHGRYFKEFFVTQSQKVRDKIAYVFQLIRTVSRVSEKFLKHLEGTDGLYEIRVDVGSDTYRIFCCFDHGNLVVLFNAFQKKSQRTPKDQIELAERLKNEYFATKEKKT